VRNSEVLTNRVNSRNLKSGGYRKMLGSRKVACSAKLHPYNIKKHKNDTELAVSFPNLGSSPSNGWGGGCVKYHWVSYSTLPLPHEFNQTPSAWSLFGHLDRMNTATSNMCDTTTIRRHVHELWCAVVT